MGQHIVKSYDEELKELVSAISTMGRHVAEILRLTKHAFDMSDDNSTAEAAQKARQIDKEINALDAYIDTQAPAMLALRQPMALDLRLIIAALKMTTILERMGDLGKNIAKRATRVGNPIADGISHDFDAAVATVITMVEDVVEAFSVPDHEKAMQVWDRDNQVNDNYKKLYQDLQQAIISDPQNVASYLEIVFAAKNFERIGDHATKLARLVLFITSGKRVNKKTRGTAKPLKSVFDE